ncbi:MAG: glycosyltransferase [Desulfonatronovibrio sp.]
MKILHIGKYYPPFHGGIENFLNDLVREQVGQGHEVKVLCHQHERGRATTSEIFDKGLEVVRVNIMGVIAYAPVAPGMYGALKKVLDKFQPEIVHAHMPNASAFWLLLTRKRFRLVIHWHSDVVSSENDWKLRTLYPFYRLFEIRLLTRADNVIATSRPYLETSIPLKQFKHKCVTIPLGIRTDKFVSPGENADFDAGSEKDAFILSAGRFTYYKGYEYLIRACTQGYKGRLIIVGDGPLRPDLERLVADLKLGNQVFMPGKLSDLELHKLFGTCTAFCLPSIERTEAFGVVLLEAMFYGRPLITTTVEGSGMNEVNIDGVTGLTVEPADSAGLARAMNHMLEDRDRAEEMGKSGRARLQEKFVMKRIVREVEKIY